MRGAKLTYKGAQRRFQKRSKRKRRADLRKTAKLTTRLRTKSPRAMMRYGDPRNQRQCEPGQCESDFLGMG